jgi:hypothetical protein
MQIMCRFSHRLNVFLTQQLRLDAAQLRHIGVVRRNTVSANGFCYVALKCMARRKGAITTVLTQPNPTL